MARTISGGTKDFVQDKEHTRRVQSTDTASTKDFKEDLKRYYRDLDVRKARKRKKMFIYIWIAVGIMIGLGLIFFILAII
jgi:hypothetical protein